MAMSGSLYLIPTPLSDAAAIATTAPSVSQLLARLEVFIVEKPKTARRFLGQFPLARPLAEMQWLVLDKLTPASAIDALLAPLLAGKDAGLLSEAGCPAVADPGAVLVRAAHGKGIKVVPLIGPSSILLALMASGLNGQRFRFHGYLPVQTEQRRNALRTLEESSLKHDETEIFIETPYRNLQLYADLLAVCAATSQLCVATDLTAASEQIELATIAERRRRPPPQIHRRPSIFVLAAV